MSNKKDQSTHSNGAVKPHPFSRISLLDKDPKMEESPRILSDETKLTAEEEAIKNFKVFIKKNVSLVQPAPDLLVKIHQRIDQLQANK